MEIRFIQRIVILAGGILMTKRNRAVGNGTATAEVLNVTVKGLKEEEEGSGKESGGSIRVLDRAMSVLGFMAESRRQVGITEIADAVGLSKATVHRILSTLRDYSVVLKDDSGRYQMGPSVLFWADAYRHRAGLAEISRPLLRRLWEESHETVHLFIFEGGEAYYLDKLDSPHPVGMRSRIGAKRDLYSTSGGRAILAALSEAELDAYLDRTELLPRTENTVTDKEELKNLLAAGRERGFCEEVEENEEGIRCVGAAILDLRGCPVGAVSISAPAYRFSDSQSLALGAKIRETALAISRELGYRG
jgi:DNA-binding IclR family transcriptional regulator